MALVIADRVKDTTTTTGTGTISLSGTPPTGYQGFSAIGDGNTTYYCIADQSGANWEVGIGTYTAAGTLLARTTVLASSNAGALVSFTAGTKDAFGTLPAWWASQASVGAMIGQIVYSVVTQTPTISIASPAVVTVANAPLLPQTGSPIVFTTTGALPTGITAGTTYWISNAVAGGTTFNLCATQADAIAGTNKITTSGSQSGVHTANNPAYTKATKGASFVITEVWGAGGAGVAATVNCGAPGGYSRKKTLTSALAASETVTVGAGATSGTGGTSSFGAWHSATGGAVGSAIAGGAAGGSGIGGDFNVPGANGTSGNYGCVLSAPFIGVSINGQAAAAAAINGRNNTGMGGTGGTTAGVGGSGLVIVTEFK